MRERESASGPGARRSSGAMLVSLVVSILMALGALIWCFGLSHRLLLAERQMHAATERNAELAQKQVALGARLRTTTETLAEIVGLTQKEIQLKTRSLAIAQAAAEKLHSEQTAKLEQQQAAAVKEIVAVATDVSAVKTDVGGAKASIAETRDDLASTQAQLERTIGDAGVMSGLIARNHDELELLKHRGERAYYEFTLQKGAKPLLLAAIKLQLKKVDVRRSKYTIVVGTDDRMITKNDKNRYEPVQFYTGKEQVLYELLVNTVTKNSVSGYLSAPKKMTQAVQPLPQ